jgi:hypothetical protein
MDSPPELAKVTRPFREAVAGYNQINWPNFSPGADHQCSGCAAMYNVNRLIQPLEIPLLELRLVTLIQAVGDAVHLEII